MITYTPPPFGCSAVSVIIPMYNAEKYIAACLESILVQTLTNFEVIIVDDCSTDSSPAIVESYRERFGGRLTLMRTKQNSGGCALPRNKGLPLSRGEYIFFMDADDLITSTALEEMYTSAKKFGAEVLYTERWYNVPENFSLDGNAQNFALKTTDKKISKNVHVFKSGVLSERIHDFIGGRFQVECWKKLVLRDLLIRNEINFPTDLRTEDFCWTLKILYHAKKILLVPDPLYFYRNVPDSLSRPSDPFKAFYQTIRNLVEGVKALDEFMRSADFFKMNADLRYAVLKFYAEPCQQLLFGSTFQTPVHIMYKVINENKEICLGEYNDLISYFVTCTYELEKINALNTHKFAQLAAQVQEQIDRFTRFAAEANNRIAELEAELQRLKS